jgi:hypothetical protein
VDRRHRAVRGRCRVPASRRAAWHDGRCRVLAAPLSDAATELVATGSLPRRHRLARRMDRPGPVARGDWPPAPVRSPLLARPFA